MIYLNFHFLIRLAFLLFYVYYVTMAGLAAYAIPVAASAVGSTIAGLATYAATATAAIKQSNTAKETNQTNLDFQNSVIGRGEKAFTDVGLPRAMYYSGNSIASPNTLVHLGGQNFYEQSGVNANLPYIGVSPYTQYNHAGSVKPVNSTQMTSQGPATTKNNSNLMNVGQTFVKEVQGQTDRVGLGAGRYSSVPPPVLDYNSRSTQTGFSSRDQGVQASPPTRTSYSNTGASYTRNVGVATWGLNTPMSLREYPYKYY